MKQSRFLIGICVLVACTASLNRKAPANSFPAWVKTWEDSLLYWYSQPSEAWPAPTIDSGIAWTELGVVPQSPLQPELEKLKDKIALGRMLFFDPALSGSGKISCASCHMPGLSWADGREKSIGHEGQLNRRNSPTILNTWFYKHYFWDGRSNSLEDQAFSPINSETEMHSSMSDAMMTLRKMETYGPYFQKAFGSPEISPETLTEAIATFERTLVSGKADFDRFLEGDTSAMSRSALRGLHLFRTKARCMNCHHSALLTDNSFHNTGISNYGERSQDLGRYMVTHLPEDVGKFKTPSLRDVMRTGPWMHNGLFDRMEDILKRYNAGMPQPEPKKGQENDPLFPKADPLLRKLGLTEGERADVMEFLKAITAEPVR